MYFVADRSHMTSWLTDEQQRLWRGLRLMTSRLDERLSHDLQQQSALSLPDYDVLVRLSEASDGRLRMFQLLQDLHWKQSRLSQHIGRMQHRGLVAREACTTDRRGAFVVLTPAGRDAIAKAAPAHVHTVRALVFDDLSASHAATLEAFLAQIMSRL